MKLHRKAILLWSWVLFWNECLVCSYFLYFPCVLFLGFFGENSPCRLTCAVATPISHPLINFPQHKHQSRPPRLCHFVSSISRMPIQLPLSMTTSSPALSDSSVLVSSLRMLLAIDLRWFTCLHCAVEIVFFPAKQFLFVLSFSLVFGNLKFIHSSCCWTPYIGSEFFPSRHFLLILVQALLYRKTTFFSPSMCPVQA